MTLQEWIDRYGVNSAGMLNADELGRTAANSFGDYTQVGVDDRGYPIYEATPGATVDYLTGNHQGDPKGKGSFQQWKSDGKGGWLDPETVETEYYGGGGLHHPAGAKWTKPLALAGIAAIAGGAGANALGLLGPGAGTAAAPSAAGASTAGGGGSFIESLLGQSLMPGVPAGVTPGAVASELLGQSFAAPGAFAGLGGATVEAAAPTILDKVLKGATSPSALNALATVAGGLLGGTGQSDSGGGTAARAPFTPSGKTMGQKTYSPNANNVAEMQRYLDYMAKRGNPKRDAYAALGGGSKYTGLLG